MPQDEVQSLLDKIDELTVQLREVQRYDDLTRLYNRKPIMKARVIVLTGIRTRIM